MLSATPSHDLHGLANPLGVAVLSMGPGLPGRGNRPSPIVLTQVLSDLGAEIFRPVERHQLAARFEELRQLLPAVIHQDESAAARDMKERTVGRAGRGNRRSERTLLLPPVDHQVDTTLTVDRSHLLRRGTSQVLPAPLLRHFLPTGTDEQHPQGWVKAANQIDSVRKSRADQRKIPARLPTVSRPMDTCRVAAVGEEMSVGIAMSAMMRHRRRVLHEDMIEELTDPLAARSLVGLVHHPHCAGHSLRPELTQDVAG